MAKNSINNIEILTTNLGKLTISSVYKPLNEKFVFMELDNFRYKMTKIMVSDFKSWRELRILQYK